MVDDKYGKTIVAGSIDREFTVYYISFYLTYIVTNTTGWTLYLLIQTNTVSAAKPFVQFS
jgi:quinol-cytochrome oxidoreductase complex cytochrome b subunit